MESFFAIIGVIVVIPGAMLGLLYLLGRKDSKEAKQKKEQEYYQYKENCEKLRRHNEYLTREVERLKKQDQQNNSPEHSAQLKKQLDLARQDLRSRTFDLDQSRRQIDSLKSEIKRLNKAIENLKSDSISSQHNPKDILRIGELENQVQRLKYQAENSEDLKHIGQLEDQLQTQKQIAQKAVADKMVAESQVISLKRQCQKLQFEIDEDEERERELLSTIDSQKSNILDLQSRYNFLIHTGNTRPLNADRLPLLDQKLFEQYMDQLSSERISRAITGQFVFEISAKVMSGKECYTTTLHSCTCKDHAVRKVICKHMMALALYVNAFVPYDSDVNKKVTSAANDLMYAGELLEETEKIKRMAEKVNKAIDDKKQTFPLLADVLANFKEQRRNVTIKDNITKRDLTAMIKRVEKQNAMLQHQIAVYEYMFPILNEFKDVPPQDLQSAVVEAGTTGFHYQWLSQEDFDALSDADKRQRLVDRYLNEKKSKNAWEAGIKYERYIGYLCEQQGYSVKYTGALLKLNDMGRDLIVSKGKNVYVVQCKRYADHKEIHENHLFQLFGSVMHYATEHPDKNVRGVFVTSAAFSLVAAECAKKLDIKVYEHLRFEPYPAIKCNIGRSGEKIYHLPFDQQYDTVTVETRKGEMYVSTIKEAEDAGYRHAMRHSFNA